MPKVESIDGVDIRCLSIRHPWASMLVDRERGIGTNHIRIPELGLEDYKNQGIDFLGMEVRTRQMPFRGLILIRQSQSSDLRACHEFEKSPKPQNPGLVIGWGRLVGVVPTPRRFATIQLLNRYAKHKVEGAQKVYLIADPKKIEEPFPTRGLEQLYRVNQLELTGVKDPELLREIKRLMREINRKRLEETQRLRSMPTQPALPWSNS